MNAITEPLIRGLFPVTSLAALGAIHGGSPCENSDNVLDSLRHRVPFRTKSRAFYWRKLAETQRNGGVMAYTRSGETTKISGRSQEALRRDRALFEELEGYMPESMIREKVATFLTNQCLHELKAATGDPAAILAALAEMGDVPADLRPRLEKALEATVVEFHAEQDHDFVAGEAVHAKGELVRAWINQLCTARDLLKRPSFAVDRSLNPVTGQFSADQLQAWTDAWRSIKQGLEANVALGSDDINTVMDVFASDLIQATRKTSNRMPLPLDLELATGTKSYEIVGRAFSQ